VIKLRTLQDAYESIKLEDPDTAITPYAIRLIVKQNKIPFMRSGNKYLINLETLLKYIENNTV
jgi:excisionase family DNA binding protein